MSVEIAGRDPDYVPTIMAMSLGSPHVSTNLWIDETTHRLLVNTVISSFTTAGNPVITSIASANTNTTILAANANRKMACIFNDSTSPLYIKLGATAANNSYTVKMAAGSYYELPSPVYTGEIDGVWVAVNGQCLVTEIV